MSQFQRGRQAKYHGLVNQGATCYLNSVLQVLFMTKNFRERVASHSHIENDAKKGSVETELSDLFNTLEKHQADTHSLTKKLKINSVSEQRDAAEHYEKILRNISPKLSKIFHGELINRNICQECNAKTETAAGFWSLPLPLLNDNNEYSVEKGIKDFFRPSKISGDDQMYCEKCDKKCDAVLDCEVTHYPKVLVLLLKRFELACVGNVWEKVKINCPVKMPDTLQMEQNNTYTQYKLYAYVKHYGSLRHGHYTATIKSQDDGQWYIFNDLNVEVSSYNYFQLDPTETSKSVYLLFYQKEKDTSVDRHNTPDTLPATTLLKGIEDHHSSSKEPVTPVSKRNMKEDRPRNDEQNERKRRKTNKKHELGPEECSERSQVLEDRYKETSQNFDSGKQSKHREPNVKGSYRASRDVNEKPKMHNKHKEGEDLAMTKMPQPEYLLYEWSPQKARCDTRHVSQQDSRQQNFDSVRQSKHTEQNVESSYSSTVHEKAKMHNKRNEGEDQAMAEMQMKPDEYSTQQPRRDKYVRGVAEYRQDGMMYKDRDRQSRQVNRSNSYASSQNEKQWEFKRQQSKPVENFSDHYSQSNNTWDKQNVSQQFTGTALNRQDVQSFENKRGPCGVRRSKSCAPSQNRALSSIDWQPSMNNPGSLRGERGKSSVRNETDQTMRYSFHESHRQYCSHDNQLENLRKEFQNNKTRNDGLKKNSRDGQNDNFQKPLEKLSQVPHYKEQKPQQTNPQQCLARWESRQSNYRQNLQTGHSQNPKGTCDDISKIKDRKKLCQNTAKPEAELTHDNLTEEMKRLSLSSPPRNSEEELETNCRQSRKGNKCLSRCRLRGWRRYFCFLSCKKKTHQMTRHAHYQI